MQSKKATIKIDLQIAGALLAIALLVFLDIVLVTNGFQSHFEVKDTRVDEKGTQYGTVKRVPGWAAFWESSQETRCFRPLGSYSWDSENPNGLHESQAHDLLEHEFDVVDIAVKEAWDETDTLKWGTCIRAEITFETGDKLTRLYKWNEYLEWQNVDTGYAVTEKEDALLREVCQLENTTVVEVKVREGENWKWTYYLCILKFRGGQQITRAYLHKQKYGWCRYPTMTPLEEDAVRREGLLQAYDRKCAEDMFGKVGDSQSTIAKEVE